MENKNREKKFKNGFFKVMNKIDKALAKLTKLAE